LVNNIMLFFCLCVSGVVLFRSPRESEWETERQRERVVAGGGSDVDCGRAPLQCQQLKS